VKTKIQVSNTKGISVTKGRLADITTSAPCRIKEEKKLESWTREKGGERRKPQL